MFLNILFGASNILLLNDLSLRMNNCHFIVIELIFFNNFNWAKRYLIVFLKSFGILKLSQFRFQVYWFLVRWKNMPVLSDNIFCLNSFSDGNSAVNLCRSQWYNALNGKIFNVLQLV